MHIHAWILAHQTSYHMSCLEATTQSTGNTEPGGLCVCFPSASKALPLDVCDCSLPHHLEVITVSPHWGFSIPSTKLNLPTGCTLPTAHVSSDFLCYILQPAVIYLFICLSVSLTIHRKVSSRVQRFLPVLRNSLLRPVLRMSSRTLWTLQIFLWGGCRV